MEGGTTFYFVGGEIEEALGLAKQAAGDKDVKMAITGQIVFPEPQRLKTRLGDLSTTHAKVLLICGLQIVQIYLFEWPNKSEDPGDTVYLVAHPLGRFSRYTF